MDGSHIPAGVLLALATVCQAQLFPVGQELLYSYHGHVQNTIENPTLFSSEYFINATLHIKGFSNGSLVSLEGLTYGTYMGEGKITDETISQPLPPETECLQLPFFVQYSLDGRVLDVLTHKDDQLWCIGIKQAISSLLQLDYMQIDLTKTKPYAFLSDEKLVYGQCQMQCDMVPRGKTSWTLRKWITQCKDKKWHMNFNVDSPGHCEVEFDNSIQRTSSRVYDLEWLQKVLFINKIESDGSTMFYPINGKGGAHSVHVKQLLTKLTMMPMKDSSDTENMIPKGLKVLLYTQNAVLGSVPDTTLGRSTVDLETLMPRMREKLHLIVQHLKNSHVTLKEPEWVKGQIMQEIIIYLRQFDMHSLEHCFHILRSTKDIDDQGMLDVFLQILPYIGTHASNVFIRNIIKSKHVTAEVATHILQEMPFHTKFPNALLLKELVELTQMDTEITEEVRGAALLCFSNLVSKVLKSYPDDPEVNVYVDYFMDTFKNSKDHYTQMLYISALQNLESARVTKFLEPLIMNQKTILYNKVNPLIRNLAIWAAKHTHSKQPEVANLIYWPILENKNEPLEIRTSALNILMTNPSLSDQLKIYWYMMTETDTHLYSVYYTTLKSLAGSTSPCLVNTSLNSKRILQYIRVPSNVTTSSAVYQYDYYDSGFNMGAMLRTSNIGNLLAHLTTSFYVQFSSHISNLMVNQYSNYMQLSISKHFRKIIQSTMKMPDLQFSDLMMMIAQTKELVSPDDFQVEYISMLRNRVVAVKYYSDPLKLMNLWQDLIKHPGSRSDGKYSMGLTVDGTVVVPTDMGVPVSIYVSLPTVQKIKWLFQPETVNRMDITKLRVDLLQWNYQTYGIQVYDPITNVWHGGRRCLTVDSYLPISVDLNINVMQKTAKISFNTVKTTEPIEGNIGFQSFVQSQIYQYDMNKQEFVHVEKVSKGIEHRKQYVVMDKELEDVGLHMKVLVYDCERDIPLSRLIYLQREFLSNYNKNMGNMPAMKMVLAIRHWWAYSTLSAMPGMCGMGVMLMPSTQQPATHADLTMRMVSEPLLEGGNHVGPSTKSNFRFTYNLKNDEKVVKSWDLHLITSLLGTRVSDINAVLTRMKPDTEDYKICVNGEHLWKDTSISSIWTVLMGTAVDNKCPQDAGKLKITVKNGLTTEQIEDMSKMTPNYSECPDSSQPLKCIMTKTSLRHYEYDMMYTNVPEQAMQMWMSLHDWIRKEYSHHFERLFLNDKLSQQGHLKMILEYPMQSDSVNLTLYTPTETVCYQDIPLNNWYWTGLVHPYSKHVSALELLNYFTGLTYLCHITPESLTNHFQIQVPYEVPQDWTLYASTQQKSHNWQILVKKVEGKYPLAVRVVVSNDHLDIYYRESGFEFLLNDKKLESLSYGYRTSHWFEYRVSRKDHKVFLHVPSANLNLEYDGNLVNAYLKRGLVYNGLCYENPKTYEDWQT